MVVTKNCLGGKILRGSVLTLTKKLSIRKTDIKMMSGFHIKVSSFFGQSHYLTKHLDSFQTYKFVEVMFKIAPSS